MRNLDVKLIVEAVKNLCIESNCNVSRDIKDAIGEAINKEASPIGREILLQLEENGRIAYEKQVPICQDTGMAVIFVEVGQEVHLTGGDLTDAINEGVRQGYKEGYLRKSIVKDPFIRENTKDNTPAIIHYEIVPGDGFHLTVSPKGIGSENMSRIYMLTPSDGIEGVKKVILETIDLAGGNACPPMIVGIGIGGSFEKAALLSKKALLRPIDEHSPLPHIHDLEEEILEKANKLGIGPQGLGGTTTVIGVNIETYPTHIAGLPVAINIGCHVTRHGSVTL